MLGKNNLEVHVYHSTFAQPLCKVYDFLTLLTFDTLVCIRADIPALAAKMVEAVCLCELHLSSNLCDVKFHALVHAALSITALGAFYIS